MKSNVIVAKQKTGPTFVWLGPPGSSVTASDPSFGQLSATPHTIVSVTEISAQAQYQMGPVSEHFTRRNLALGLAAGAEQAMLVGAGGTEPLGIVNTPGINTVVGTSLDMAKSIDMQKQACDANAVVNPATQGYVTPPTTAALLAGRQQFTGVDSTLWKGSIARGEIVGVPAMSTKAMTVGSLLFGDFSQLILVEFGPMQIAVNHADFNKGMLAVRALWMVDVILADLKSFTLAASVT
jgi:HK97 family phage major capsid protein